MEQTQKKIYFASDFHLGYPSAEESKERERLIISWLDAIKQDCQELYLVGDIFDFWFEYKYVAPQGYVRFLSKLTEFVDAGIPVNFFCGNHDMWYRDYLTREIGITIFDEPIERTYFGKTFYIHHGHALGKYDKGMNFLNMIFSSKFLRWLFSFVPVNWAYGFGHAWSLHNRTKRLKNPQKYETKQFDKTKEYLYLYAQDVLKEKHFDYFVFGHRHLAMEVSLNDTSRYVNLGNWIWNSTYAELSEGGLMVKSYKGNDFIVRE